MQFERRSEEEYIKDQGLVIDYDEIARKGKMSKEEALISKWSGSTTRTVSAAANVYGSARPGLSA